MLLMLAATYSMLLILAAINVVNAAATHVANASRIFQCVAQKHSEGRDRRTDSLLQLLNESKDKKKALEGS